MPTDATPERLREIAQAFATIGFAPEPAELFACASAWDADLEDMTRLGATGDERIKAEQERAEKAERVVASISMMLGWGSDAPSQLTLEAEIRALKARVARAESERDELEQGWCHEVVDLCPHPTSEAICCGECLAAAIRERDEARAKLREAEEEFWRLKREITCDHCGSCGEPEACGRCWTCKSEAERALADRLADALRHAERHCPCGARPESLHTHPHVLGCPIGEALAAHADARKVKP